MYVSFENFFIFLFKKWRFNLNKINHIHPLDSRGKEKKIAGLKKKE